MAIYQSLVNFDEVFNSLPDSPIIINDLKDKSEDDRNYYSNLLVTKYSEDFINLIPSCDCGEMKGEFYRNEVCKTCNSVIKSHVEDDLIPLVWFRRPTDVSKIINPAVWNMLKARFYKYGFSILVWITDFRYKVKPKYDNIIKNYTEAGYGRGYNYFVDNFQEVIKYLLSIPEYRLKKNEIDYLITLIEQESSSVFSDYIPLPNKSLLIMEKTNLGVYVDPIILNAVDSIKMLVSIDKDHHQQTSKVKQNRTIRAINKLGEYYLSFYREKLMPKKGIFRKNIYGSRTNFTFRCVITSLFNNVAYDEIHVPWGVGLTVFRPHVINKLMKLGMTLNDSIGFLLGGINKHNQILDNLLKELISESDNKLYAILHRNPALAQGSIQRVRITKFKQGPIGEHNSCDNTLSIPLPITKSFNADFDGDNMHVTLSIDRVTAESWYPLDPKFNILNLDAPHKTCKAISLPKPLIASTGGWIED